MFFYKKARLSDENFVFKTCAAGIQAIYVDGEQIAKKVTKEGRNATTVTAAEVSRNAQILAVSVSSASVGSFKGWIGATSDSSIVTDDSWKCSSTYTSGWQNIDFNDVKWTVPIIKQANSNSCIGFPSAAKRLWIKKNNLSDSSTIYCRKSLGS